MASALSALVILGVMQNYLIMKKLYDEQQQYTVELENIRAVYLFIATLYKESEGVNIVIKTDLDNYLRSSSDALAFKTKDHMRLLYLRPTQRKGVLSIYLKHNDEHSIEVISGVKKLFINFDHEKHIVVQLVFEHASVKIKMFQKTI